MGFSKTYKGARDLFSAGYIRDAQVDGKGIENAFGATGHKPCGMQRPGFNIQCKDNNKARWGFCNNIPSQGCQTSDSNDSDAAIGIGLIGNHKTSVGAGWTKDWAGKNKVVNRQTWLYVNKEDYDFVPIMKIMESKGTFGYDSAYWTNTKTYNAKVAWTDKSKDAKYEAFSTTPFSTIRMCVNSMDQCVYHTFSKTFKSARELFSSGYIRDSKLDQKGIEAAFAASGHKKCGMQRPGFNIVCKDGQKARWGFCNNIPSQGCQTSDSNDSDAAIGVGLVGNFKDKVSAGWTKDFAGKGKIVYKKVWISVATKKYDWDGWTPVMKIISGSTFGYNAKYWTDGSTLKPTSPLNKLENAKYSAFNTAPVGSIRICTDSPNKHCFDHEFKSDFPSARALFS